MPARCYLLYPRGRARKRRAPAHTHTHARTEKREEYKKKKIATKARTVSAAEHRNPSEETQVASLLSPYTGMSPRGQLMNGCGTTACDTSPARQENSGSRSSPLHRLRFGQGGFDFAYTAGSKQSSCHHRIHHRFVHTKRRGEKLVLGVVPHCGPLWCLPTHARTHTHKTRTRHTWPRTQVSLTVRQGSCQRS